jgi:ornithine cyclodeaminase/alanine dehydrogenase-like protein (mu-crystallin family)
MNVRILSGDDVRAALPMGRAIQSMRDAFACLAEGRAVVPDRIHLETDSTPPGINLFMPAYVRGDSAILSTKTVTVYPTNQQLDNVPTIHALVQVLDPTTGRTLAILEGGSLTAIRTGAASGLATDLLARRNATRALILGTGVQARTQLAAVAAVRQLTHVDVCGRNVERANLFAREMEEALQVPVFVQPCNGETVARAEIICAATTSATPLFDGEWLTPGTHINAIGSFRPDVTELDAATVIRSFAVVDDRQAALTEAGDLLQPIKNGLIDESHIRATLGELVLNEANPTKRLGRVDEQQITLFKSCGLGVQDAFAAQYALVAAEEQQLGTVVAL